MNFMSVSGHGLKQTFIELHKDLLNDPEFANDQALLDEVFEQWVDSLLESGAIQFASMNN